MQMSPGEHQPDQWGNLTKATMAKSEEDHLFAEKRSSNRFVAMIRRMKIGERSGGKKSTLLAARDIIENSW